MKLYNIVQQLRRKFGRCATRKNLRIGDFVGIKLSTMPDKYTHYGQVTRFYPIIYGGEGVQIGNSSQPIDQITSVVFFKNEQAMWAAARQVRSEAISQDNF